MPATCLMYLTLGKRCKYRHCHHQHNQDLGSSDARTRAIEPVAVGAEFVSILARPEGRAQPAFAAGMSICRVEFQSSPGPKAERNRLAARTPCCQSRGFNPRPARRPSATGHRPRERVRALPVSILARPEGRAQHYLALAIDEIDPVSILARPEGRAQPDAVEVGVAVTEFQSSPGPKAERNAQQAQRRLDLIRVSILARPEGRAQLGRPARRADRAELVSILARPEGRAQPLPRRVDVVEVHEVSILARPEGRAQPCWMGVLSPFRKRFQSSPGPKAERNTPGHRSRLGSTRSFNPRPARRPSATSLDR